MTVEAEQRTSETGDHGDVSGAVVHVLINLVFTHSGDVGVAQALALAGDRRPFSTLGDLTAWSSLDQTVALFNAAALVTGDGAVGLHVGEELLYSPDGTDFVDRLRLLGTPVEAFRHVGPLAERFETTSVAVALEVTADHALLQFSPRTGPARHAHLCEMTRGLLTQVPALYGLGPALVSETECSARGGRSCLYAVSWEEPTDPLPPGPPRAADDEWLPADDGAVGGVRPHLLTDGYDGYDEGEDGYDDEYEYEYEEGDEGEDGYDDEDEYEDPFDDEGPGYDPPVEVGGRGLGGDRGAGRAGGTGRSGSAPGSGWDVLATEPGADSTVEELRAELDRLSVFIEGAFATADALQGGDVEGLLSQIAERADEVVASHRYLLMVRVRPGTPIQLHSRGLDQDEAQQLAGELWRESPERDGGTRIIVDIASPRRLYGRLVELLPPGTLPPAAETKMLSLYAEYAAIALDIFGVLNDARRSNATARTLLSFSEARSRVTKLNELLQLLADTVPEVTDCDQSTVYLWDQARGLLVPRARTAGMESPDAYLGPIKPVTGDSDPGGRSTFPTVPRGGWLQLAGNGHDPAPTGPEGPGATRGGHPGSRKGEPDDLITVRTDNPLLDRMINAKEVIVLDPATEDPLLQNLLSRSKTAASVVAPLFASGEFLGVIAANFGAGTPTHTIRDSDLHERLSGLADQAATAVQNLSLLETVSHLAWHDALTGLPNRRLFEDRVEQELVRSRRVGEPVCMFFVDLDHFKAVNDTMGHAAGDELIRQASKRLVDTVRRQDTVARVGGDEFAILLPGLSDQVAIDQLAQRSLEAVSAPFSVFGEEVATSASIGIAMAPDHGDSYDELLSRADEAMYRAKGRGRNAFEMYSGSPAADSPGGFPLDERSLQADLVHGLEREEFFVLYQPYIDLRTSQVVGVEALVRWRHPTLGILEPTAFIPLAERSDVIVGLDTWVLEQACRQSRIWRDRGLGPLRISVNLASRDLSDPGLFDNIERALDQTAIDPSLLELEITERVVLDRSGPAKENIERLRRLGVRFTIDDFGTANSSLSRIGSFPVSTLKIDQSFVQVLGPDGDNNTLVSAIISMADRLGLDCVAEGVETSVQSRVLLQRGCTTAQGYFFSPPLPADELETMLVTMAAADGSVTLGDGVG
jgi:diguanylate cyclase (GGDEF)-like protein